MKYFLSLSKILSSAILISFHLIGTSIDANKIDRVCTFQGKPIYGKIKIVKNFPDIRVQVVDHFPDIKVKIVDSFADSCGEWKMTDSFPDIKIEYVTSAPGER
ncbi:hypothetical protein A0128_02910 [Leptospira tipperaryensis]|uniref:7(1) septoil knot domain-containing protein n=1 Tax=Leptospira tipperaryensis TaxID=2564040 RepID=A0A1D7UTK2_9LEPT|nr:hypothetical protein [Leptospira tipperaryensis]AOP32906.1 hypothetical protein A0128_02910 [Leptospira tipperaryensis]